MKTHAVRLPFHFNAEATQKDLNGVLAEEWHSHYNHREYEGDWAVAPLRSVGGHPAVIHAAPNTAHFFKNTPLLERSPAFREVLEAFQCPIGAARLMRLGAGARILEHSDHMGEGEGRELRLHIPIQTNAQVRFRIDHKLVPMMPGELWYADFNLPHSVENNGTEDRIHLVVDCLVNDWLENLIQNAIATEKICAFLDEIGIPNERGEVGEDSFLPGVTIRNGRIIYDPEKLLYPGDLLHEAGHIAVMEEKETLQANAAEGDPNADGAEIAAVLWSYAAVKAAELPEEVVFHPNGYKGQSDWLINSFRSGQYIGLPLLEWMGLTAGPQKAETLGVAPFPNMMRWLR